MLGEDRGVFAGELGGLEVAEVTDTNRDRVIRHDAHRADPGYAFALSRLDMPAFEHVPVGVFRKVRRPVYDELVNEQVSEARAERGEGELASLLSGGDTWTVD